MIKQTINKTTSKIELEPIEFSSGEGAFNIWEEVKKQKEKVEEMRALVIQKGLTPQQIKTEKKAEEMVANCNCEGV